MEIDQNDEAISFSSKGSTVSGWGRHKMSDHDKMTATWRQLYLSRAKLKAVSRTSALIAGFAMIAMVEVQLDATVTYPPALLITFSTVTTCLVSVHLFALMISTCILPNIEAISNIHSLNAAKYSPHVKMRTYIEVSWVLSTGVGLVLFLVEIALLIWLKFIGIRGSSNCVETDTNCTTSKTNGENGLTAAWFATAVLIPVVILFAGFAFHFYRALAKHKFGVFHSFMKEINGLELKEDEMNFGIQRPTGPYVHQDISRVHSAVSETGQQLQINSHFQAPGQEKIESFPINQGQARSHSRKSSISGATFTMDDET